MKALGNYVGGEFLAPHGEALCSRNPAAEGAVVFETGWNLDDVDAAAAAAAAAAPAWVRLSIGERFAHLVRFRDALSARAAELAEAIVVETGKLRSEAKAEVASLISRFDLVRQTAAADLAEGPLAGNAHEQLRFHPLGVVGVIGPFNYPLHLCHAHVVPALLLGNAVVVKPSDVTPLAGQRYAEAAHAAGLPPGVFNLVAGTGAVGAALVQARAVRGLCFTGSYAVGRRISEAALDRPELLVALEMGGKNTAIVFDDASVRQAAHEIVLGGYLSTGQRCTCTDRVLVQRPLFEPLVTAIAAMVRALVFGHPDDARSFAGPMATAAGRERFEAALAAARAGGATAVVPSQRLPGGSYAGASLHVLPDGCHDLPGYTDTELFGPDLGVEVFDSDDEAIAVLNRSAYGFANAVFTGSSPRFERVYRETHSGILNRNRSTNLASPRLPFGGVGKSGNYRPAGSYAQRNVVVPMAVQDNVIGTIATHPMLADHLPAPDLDRLARQHAGEEAAEADRSLIATPRPLGLRLPRGGKLPTSDAWLVRLYAGDRVVREKKPAVFDHLRSWGPWFVSVDSEPLSVLDGMSQTATVCAGFGEDPVVKAFVEGDFAETVLVNHDTSVAGVEVPAARAYAETLRLLVPGLPHVTFTNAGAEANEKALALCQLHCKRPVASKVLAFEGSFHGRTLVALHATHSPAKRTPFEIAGYEATFAPFPVWLTPSADEPAAPAGFYAAAAAGDLATLEARFGDARAKEDPLLAAEVAALSRVHAALGTGAYFACIIEPMQSEGGDRYATERFFRALRLLTRHHETALILDEVQCGFGLGGPFAWHARFRLVNGRGQPDYPDALVFAKRAQLGVVMSRFEDPEPTSVQTASLVRGRLHAEMMSTSHGAARVEKLVAPRLAAIARAFPDLVQHPRGCGYAFAFDLPSAAHLNAFLGQRFWRGAIVFGAGTRTARYRLSETYWAREVELLFDCIRRSLSWLDAHPNAQPPEWEDQVAAPAVASAPAAAAAKPEIRFRSLAPGEGVALLPQILDIEYQVYEPARRTPPAHIRAALEDLEGTVTIAEIQQAGEGGEGGGAAAWQLIGFGIGAPLEHAADTEGPDGDPMLGLGNTLYSLSITVAPPYQSMGVGRSIKETQLREAAARRRPEGGWRYEYVTGRNRVGYTPSMTHLNRIYGAHLVGVLTGQYEDPEGQAIYYRIPLRGIGPKAAAAPVVASSSGVPDTIDCAGGLAMVMATAPASLAAAQISGDLYGPVVNKLTLTNYVTPAVVRSLEWIGALLPELPHLYLTSGRDETIDKALRLLRCSRKQAAVAIGFRGGYVGHTTGATRSLSDPALHAGGKATFAWPLVPHPIDDAGVPATIDAIRAAVAAAGGPAKVFGLFYELVQERTGRSFPAAFWPALAALRRELDLPLVAVENTTSSYRSGVGAFASPATGLRPDVLIWWGGAQTGYLHVQSHLYVATPLTLVSTWDGDELALVRQHHQLRALRQLDIAGAARALDQALHPLVARGLTVQGAGLYRVIEAGGIAEPLAASLGAHGIRLRRFPGGRLGVVPAVDQGLDAAARLAGALPSALRDVPHGEGR